MQKYKGSRRGCVELPYPDAKVVSILSIGGTIKYELIGESGLIDQRFWKMLGASLQQFF